MDPGMLQRQYVELMQASFQENLLDDQFSQLQQLQDPTNPDFVAEVVSLFFEDSEKLLNDLSKTFEHNPMNFKQIDAYVHQFKGSSASIGAARVKALCVAFRAYCEEENRDGCWQCLQQVKREFFLVKTRLQALLQLEEKIIAAGGTVPLLE
ncbi:histidine containing phosphotransfer protein [Selaginella moellendorffii]|uniref:Histidine-containing phosphotransfer protein n=1 Tax=Selaginella moellendorffii TaxID=88036 RepID=D8R529_SELML|nr:histidine-containing phosphotransfer protein 1 [Selaginella moellendorffii]XP_002978004.1 histidine-containing phosphotransfer protein 1 [Selaginella moellendorffii]EFJ20661.1 hypothetical protein SELMODRAFT_152299 [Selaginella moellendorffii]EFJ32771.1 histidine containing phosphotransfer protein [Selaginella moellendorffii]|eukprot:XP_002966744.1 histidine-containing phosphotransfer protein 1 [Selaginella moellendorffii]